MGITSSVSASILPQIPSQGKNYLDSPLIIMYNKSRNYEEDTTMITVKKPTTAEAQAMQSKPIWTCGVSEFDW